MVSGEKNAAKALLTSRHSKACFFRASKPPTLYYFPSHHSCCHPLTNTIKSREVQTMDNRRSKGEGTPYGEGLHEGGNAQMPLKYDG